MDIIPQIFTAKVSHQRLFPKKNQFTYSVYYLVLPLPAPTIQNWFLRFYPKDLGERDGSNPEIFAQNILRTYGFDDKITHIMLITMPRVLGYIFNPVSFYLCFDTQKQMLAVIAEVHNTFGEQHTYFCGHAEHSPIASDAWLTAEKVFHVSPFLPRNGSYRFRFALKKNTMGIWIDYFDAAKNKQLMTSLTGTLAPLTKASLNRAFWSHPLVTLKTIILIHWQAAKLFCKKITYFPKPQQHKKKLSATLNISVSRQSEKIDVQ